MKRRNFLKGLFLSLPAIPVLAKANLKEPELKPIKDKNGDSWATSGRAIEARHLSNPLFNGDLSPTHEEWLQQSMWTEEQMAVMRKRKVKKLQFNKIVTWRENF